MMASPVASRLSYVEEPHKEFHLTPDIAANMHDISVESPGKEAEDWLEIADELKIAAHQTREAGQINATVASQPQLYSER